MIEFPKALYRGDESVECADKDAEDLARADGFRFWSDAEPEAEPEAEAQAEAQAEAEAEGDLVAPDQPIVWVLTEPEPSEPEPVKRGPGRPKKAQ